MPIGAVVALLSCLASHGARLLENDFMSVQEAGEKIIYPNGFVLSPYAETGPPGPGLKGPPRKLWHASPGSSGGLPAGITNSGQLSG